MVLRQWRPRLCLRLCLCLRLRLRPLVAAVMTVTTSAVTLVPGPWPGHSPGMAAAPGPGPGPVLRADAVVLVNSASPSYDGFTRHVKLYLDHFGIPYRTVDISAERVTRTVGTYAVVIVGHRSLDPGGALLSAAEQSSLGSAVAAGTGLVNFDNDLSADGRTGRYPLVGEVFGFGYGAEAGGSGATFPATGHYITERHPAGSIKQTRTMRLAGVRLPGDVTAVATSRSGSGSQPLVAVTSYGAGRAVQFGSYDWMSYDVLGPMYGLDDLVWRSIAWAARKPFVMQGLPPFLTMRVDDATGPFHWLRIAGEFGLKPWAGLYVDEIDDSEAAELSALVRAGQATASIHAFKHATWFFWQQTDEQIAANFRAGTKWHAEHDIPISTYVLAHWYQMGGNAFPHLRDDWGVRFVGMQMEPDRPYGAPWIRGGPFRRHAAGRSSSAVPGYYADYVTVPGRPELDGAFFNCVTEIRDDAGYEWFPRLDDVEGTVMRGTRQLERAFDAMALPTLFTHGANIDPAEPGDERWRAILRGITGEIREYDPIPVTMDQACQYVRATVTSDIAGAAYDPATRTLTADFTGSADLATKYYVFGHGERRYLADVPPFTGTATARFTIPAVTGSAR